MSDATRVQRTRRMAREPGIKGAPAGVVSGGLSPRNGPGTTSKSALLLQLLSREEGATLDQMVGATGWQPHTTRAALTGFRKKGHAVTSEKQGDTRFYRVASAPEAA